jgi:hypothetical protein
MSHGTYYDSYNVHNPLILHKKYKDIDYKLIQKFIYYNFMQIGELITPLIRDNPDVLFVVASGNSSGSVDREKYLPWDSSEPRQEYPIPTWFGSFAGIYDNVICVAATYDGERLTGSSNTGLSVDFAKFVGTFSVPGDKGWSPFTGTSSAAAETSRLMEQVMLKYGDKLPITPAYLKALTRRVATPKKSMKNQVFSGGMLEDQAVFTELDRLVTEQGQGE